MKKLKFSTIAGRTYQVQFDPNSFFDFMKRCGIANLNIKNQIALYLNNLHESLIQAGVPYDAIQPQTIVYHFSAEFRKQYNDTNNILKYDL